MSPITYIALVVILVILVAGFLGARRYFLKEWMPSVITGLFLVGIVPVANQIYWMRQKDLEICIQDREKRYELLGSVARTYTNLFKIHTRLHHLSKERLQEEQALRKLAARGKAPKQLLQAHLSRLAALASEESDLKRERIRLEGQIGADSALIARFYTSDVLKRYVDLASLYDSRTSEATSFIPRPDDPLVRGAGELLQSVDREARAHECK